MHSWYLLPKFDGPSREGALMCKGLIKSVSASKVGTRLSSVQFVASTVGFPLRCNQEFPAEVGPVQMISYMWYVPPGRGNHSPLLK